MTHKTTGTFIALVLTISYLYYIFWILVTVNIILNK